MVIFLSHVALGFQPLAFALWHCILFLTHVFLLCDFPFYIMHSTSHIAQFSNHTYFCIAFFYSSMFLKLFSLFCFDFLCVWCVQVFFLLFLCFFFCNYFSTCLYFPCPYFRAYFFFSLAFGDFHEFLHLFYITPISTSQLLLLEPSFCVAFTSQLIFLT